MLLMRAAVGAVVMSAVHRAAVLSAAVAWPLHSPPAVPPKPPFLLSSFLLGAAVARALPAPGRSVAVSSRTVGAVVVWSEHRAVVLDAAVVMALHIPPASPPKPSFLLSSFLLGAAVARPRSSRTVGAVVVGSVHRAVVLGAAVGMASHIPPAGPP